MSEVSCMVENSINFMKIFDLNLNNIEHLDNYILTRYTRYVCFSYN